MDRIYLARLKALAEREAKACRGYSKGPGLDFSLEYTLNNPRSRSAAAEGHRVGTHALNALALRALIKEVEG